MDQRVPRRFRLTPKRFALAALATVGGVWLAGLGRGMLEDRAEAQALALARYAERAALATEHAAFTASFTALRRQTIELGPGTPLSLGLAHAGMPRKDIEGALAAVRRVFDPYRLRGGQPIDVSYEKADGAVRLAGLAFYSDPGQAVTVTRLHDGAFFAREEDMPTQRETAHLIGEIQSSLYASALKAGATDREVAQVADVFAYDLDFQRDIRGGDAFEMVFEREFDELGRTVETGEMLFVRLATQRGEKAFYRFLAPGEAKAEWYDAAGRAARKFLMRTPINGARLSSNFGMRRHPILGYSKMHQGTDFAAPTGTPVLAAGDGVVTRANVNGGYGRYIAIRHSGDYTTAYAHLNGYARGVRPGARVRQGQVIGYVGSTGRSTGPHLHYEVLHRGRQINPMTIKVATSRNLSGAALAAFEVERARIDRLRGAGPAAMVTAAYPVEASGRAN